MTNFYEILGVSNDADEASLRKAYRALSLKYHPDRNPSPEAKAKFQEINEAYETLSDTQRRAQYDAELNGFHPHGMPMMDPDIGNIFNMMFGGGMPFGAMHMGGGGGGMPEIHVFHNGMPFHMGGGGGEHIFRQLHKPPPIIKNVEISLEQAYNGCTIQINLEKWVLHNNIKVIEPETIYLTIPAGADNGETVILRDCGNTVNENLKGDVKFVIAVSNNSEFIRQGMDLLYKKTITLKESLTGFSFEVKHINGRLLSLNNKTNRTVIHPNFKKVIPNLGMCRDANKGNLIIEFDVSFPQTLSEEQMEKLAEVL